MVLIFYAAALIAWIATIAVIMAKKGNSAPDTEREAEDYDSDSLQRRAW